MLLILMAGLTVGLLMERHGISYRAIARNIGNYKNHHRAAGIKECVLRWLSTARGRVDQVLDDDGLAFRLDVRDEGVIEVFFEDAQGSIVSDTTSLTGRRREIVEDMKFLLDQVPPDQRPDDLYRPVGPAELSFNMAPDMAIRALCLSVISVPDKALDAAEAIVRRRESGKAAPGDIAGILRELPIQERERREIASMLVSSPSLYKVRADTRDTSGYLLDRSVGLYKVDDTKSDTFAQGGAFLTWDSLTLEDRDRLPSARYSNP
jgi:hypothetical protein